MPASITKALAMAILAFSMVLATPLDPSTHSLVKRGDWVPGKSKCPNDDGREYDGPKGGAWRITCNADTENSGSLTDLNPKGNVSFETCIQLCGDHKDRCHRVSFVGDVNNGGACYLKDGSGSLKKGYDNSHVVATKLNN